MAKEAALTAPLGLEKKLMREKPQPLKSENMVLRSVQAGNTMAYQYIVQQYKKTAYFIALGFVHNTEDAMDLSQDAFIKAFRKIKSFDAGRAFFPWFYQILKRLCLDYLKKKSRRHEVPLEEVIIIKHEGVDREMKDTLRKGLTKLSPDQREVIILRYFRQLSYSEIAEMTGKPLGSVMSSLYYAKKNLKNVLEKYLGKNPLEQG